LVELGPKFHKMFTVFVSVVLAKTRQLAHTFYSAAVQFAMRDTYLWLSLMSELNVEIGDKIAMLNMNILALK